MHAAVDISSVVLLRRWARVYAHPPCCQMLITDAGSMAARAQDGRAFYGLIFALRMLAVHADELLVEQPPTILARFFRPADFVARPAHFGDASGKEFHFYLSGLVGSAPQPARNGKRDWPTAAASVRHPAAVSRDQWRSSWLRHPRMVAALAALRTSSRRGVAHDASFSQMVEHLAAAWHRGGFPVPADYQSTAGQPIDLQVRAYQLKMGAGDGRHVTSVVPALLRASAVSRPGIDVE